MSQDTAVGVIAKGSRDACIALARILLPEDCQIASNGIEWEISFAVETDPISLLKNSRCNAIKCGIPMIRYEDDIYNEYIDDDKADDDEDDDVKVVYEHRNIIEIARELQLDVRVLNMPLEQDFPTYLHVVNGECKTHIDYAPVYAADGSEEAFDPVEEFGLREYEYLPDCEPEFCKNSDELAEIWNSQFGAVFSEYGFGHCIKEWV